MGADQMGDPHGLIVLSPKVSATADVAVYLAVGAVNPVVAEAALEWMTTLTHHMRIKDRLLRDGQWNDRTDCMGCELRDCTLGSAGSPGKRFGCWAVST